MVDDVDELDELEHMYSDVGGLPGVPDSLLPYLPRNKFDNARAEAAATLGFPAGADPRSSSDVATGLQLACELVGRAVSRDDRRTACRSDSFRPALQRRHVEILDHPTTRPERGHGVGHRDSASRCSPTDLKLRDLEPPRDSTTLPHSSRARMWGRRSRAAVARKAARRRHVSSTFANLGAEHGRARR